MQRTCKKSNLMSGIGEESISWYMWGTEEICAVLVNVPTKIKMLRPE